MNECPRTLRYFSLFLLGVAASMPLQIMWLYGHGFSEWQSVFLKISPMNWIVMTLTMMSAVSIFRASPKAPYLGVLAAVAVTFNNLVVGALEADYSPLLATLATGGYIAAHLVLCQQKIINLFRHPDQRWWLTPRRMKLAVAVFVSPLNGAAFRSTTYDISENGVFIKLGGDVIDVLAASRSRAKVRSPEFTPNERLTVCLTLGQFRQFRCDARVVRRAMAKGVYPDGLALVFEGLAPQQRRELKKFIALRAA